MYTFKSFNCILEVQSKSLNLILTMHIQIFQLYTRCIHWTNRYSRGKTSASFCKCFYTLLTHLCAFLIQNLILHSSWYIGNNVKQHPPQCIHNTHANHVNSRKNLFSIILSKYVWLRMAITRAHSQVTFQKLSIKTSRSRSLSSAKSWSQLCC